VAKEFAWNAFCTASPKSVRIAFPLLNLTRRSLVFASASARNFANEALKFPFTNKLSKPLLRFMFLFLPNSLKISSMPPLTLTDLSAIFLREVRTSSNGPFCGAPPELDLFFLFH
jgi:hypothetical protein